MADASWARWRPEIAKACRDHHTIESIERDLVAGRSKLWASEDACIVVEFHRYDGGALACRCTWAAGDIEALKRELAKLEVEAKALGCTEIVIEGRAAWARVLRACDYRPWSVTVRKEL